VAFDAALGGSGGVHLGGSVIVGDASGMYGIGGARTSGVSVSGASDYGGGHMALLLVLVVFVAVVV
jgi:hypothetical protein